jgi:hypothetical protein
VRTIPDIRRSLCIVSVSASDPLCRCACVVIRILTKRRLRLLDLIQDDTISREDMTEFCFSLRKHANDLAPLMQRYAPALPLLNAQMTVLLCALTLPTYIAGCRSSVRIVSGSTTTATCVCPGTSSDHTTA